MTTKKSIDGLTIITADLVDSKSINTNDIKSDSVTTNIMTTNTEVVKSMVLIEDKNVTIGKNNNDNNSHLGFEFEKKISNQVKRSALIQDFNDGVFKFIADTTTVIDDSTNLNVLPKADIMVSKLSTTGPIYAGTNVYVGGSSEGYLTTFNTTDATSTTVAPVLFSGGVGIGKKTYLGDNLYFSNTSSKIYSGTSALTLPNSSGTLALTTDINNAGNTVTTDTNQTISADKTFSGTTTISTLNSTTSNIINLNAQTATISGKSLPIYTDDILFFAQFHTSTNANYSKSNGSLTTSGTATITSEKLDAIGKNLTFSGLNNFKLANIGCIRFLYTPNYSGNPSNNQFMFYAGKTGTGASQIQLIHMADSTIKFTLYSTDSYIYSSYSFGTWNVTAGTEYEIELNYDTTNGATRLFIDGSQFGMTLTGTGNRVLPDVADFHLGRGISPSTVANFYMRDFLIFSTVQHTANYTKIGPYNIEQVTQGLIISLTNDATSTTQASAIISGGLGIAKKTYLGDNLYFSNSSSQIYSGTSALTLPNSSGILALKTDITDVSNMVTTDTNQTISADKIYSGLTLFSSLSTFGTGINLPTANGTPTTLNYYEKTTFTTNFHYGSELDLVSNITFSIERVGQLVTIQQLTNESTTNNITTSSNPNSFISSIALPARFIPTSNICVTYPVLSNSIFLVGGLKIFSYDGFIRFFSTNWGNFSGTLNGWYCSPVTYMVNQSTI